MNHAPSNPARPTRAPTPATSHPSSSTSPEPDARAIAERMRQRYAKADPLTHLPDVHPGSIPRHVAIIMDGNGRWARERGFDRVLGHRAGAGTVRHIMHHCGKLGVEFVTLYSFSLENWKRPAAEVGALMDLCAAYCRDQCQELQRENIRFRVIGRREGLPPEVLAAIDGTIAATASCTGPTLCLAINYGGRAEIADAVRHIAREVHAGSLDPASIDEAALTKRLYTADMPDPDLVIRTAGERRLSNFLLWQLSYAEIYVTDVLWPDFTATDLNHAIRDYAKRTRRFGGLQPGETTAAQAPDTDEHFPESHA